MANLIWTQLNMKLKVKMCKYGGISPLSMGSVTDLVAVFIVKSQGAHS